MTEKVARLKRANGDVIAEIPLPSSPSDLSLVRYISFLNEMRKLEIEGANPIQVMAQAVGEITGVPLEEVLRAKVGEQWQEHKELDGGIRSLYGWCVNALSNYKGSARTKGNFEFVYKNEKYGIPYIVAVELSGALPILPDIETGEAIEAYETMRTFQKQIKDMGDPGGEKSKRILELKKAIAKGEGGTADMMREMQRIESSIDIDGDPNGDLLFAQYLRLISILARKEGERLPANDGDRERWIQARMMHFQEIDCKTALDVDFFLAGLLTLSKKTHPVITSLILPLFALAAAIQSRPKPKERRTIAQYRTKKKYKNGSAGVRL